MALVMTTGSRLWTVRSSQYAKSSMVSVPLVTTTPSVVSSAYSTARVSPCSSAIV